MDMTQKKADYLFKLVTYAGKAEALVRDIAELNSAFADNGFATGGANAIVDLDCTGPAAHLSAALVNSAMSAMTNVNLTAPQRTIMRQTANTAIPPAS